MNQNASNDARNHNRSTYATPELTVFGSIKDLTASGSAAGKEDQGAGGGNQRRA